MDNLKKRLTNKKKGFTLVELLVVIAIIAILSVTAYVAMGGQTGKARNSRRQQDLGAIQNALEIYFVEKNSFYPDNLSDLVTGKYMPKLPADPITKADYAYEHSTTKKTYQLGATLEDLSETTPYTAYVIGNNDTPILTGIDVPDTAGCSGGSPVDGSTTCVPMDIWD